MELFHQSSVKDHRKQFRLVQIREPLHWKFVQNVLFRSQTNESLYPGKAATNSAISTRWMRCLISLKRVAFVMWVVYSYEVHGFMLWLSRSGSVQDCVLICKQCLVALNFNHSLSDVFIGLGMRVQLLLEQGHTFFFVIVHTWTGGDAVKICNTPALTTPLV